MKPKKAAKSKLVKLAEKGMITMNSRPGIVNQTLIAIQQRKFGEARRP